MPTWFLSERPGYVRVAPRDVGFTPVAVFSTRAGGASVAPYDTLNLSAGVGDDVHAVHENRRRLFAALDLPLAAAAYALQVHGDTCLEPAAPGPAGEGDALVTRDAALVLAVGIADCLALLLWDEAGRSAAAVHAGWRGAVAGVVPRALERLEGAGADPGRLFAALGPRIGPCCFRVGPDVAARFDARHVWASGGVTTVDLAGACRAQLESAGVSPARILDLGHCTSCRPEAYFSHRRDQGRTGRMWGVVALRPAPPRAAHERAV
jgi:hypothetical protein